MKNSLTITAIAALHVAVGLLIFAQSGCNSAGDQKTEKDVNADPHKLGLEGSPTRVDRIFPPPARQKGEMFSGSAVELADKFIEILKKESVIK